MHYWQLENIDLISNILSHSLAEQNSQKQTLHTRATMGSGTNQRIDCSFERPLFLLLGLSADDISIKVCVRHLLCILRRRHQGSSMSVTHKCCFRPCPYRDGVEGAVESPLTSRPSPR
jgi:hypothetical protein